MRVTGTVVPGEIVWGTWMPVMIAEENGRRSARVVVMVEECIFGGGLG